MYSLIKLGGKEYKFLFSMASIKLVSEAGIVFGQHNLLAEENFPIVIWAGLQKYHSAEFVSQDSVPSFEDVMPYEFNLIQDVLNKQILGEDYQEKLKESNEGKPAKKKTKD